jgi:hypothetical protein|tara:strand:- start:826 stop:1293 length:468 start_codon:yes stop_codon:yes gene_type:complete
MTLTVVVHLNQITDFHLLRPRLSGFLRREAMSSESLTHHSAPKTDAMSIIKAENWKKKLTSGHIISPPSIAWDYPTLAIVHTSQQKPDPLFHPHRSQGSDRENRETQLNHQLSRYHLHIFISDPATCARLGIKYLHERRDIIVKLQHNADIALFA